MAKTAKNLTALLATAIVLAFISGCGIEEPLERITPEKGPKTAQLPDAYNQLQINRSSSADVLAVIKQNENELISQSESVIASFGEKKKGYQFWMTMASFGEEAANLSRKYFLAVDEKPWHLGAKGQKLRFDCQALLGNDVLEQAYTSNNQKRIAVLEELLETFRNDAARVRDDSTVIDTGVMMTNQTLERILFILEKSPALAEKLGQENGLEFDHLTFGKSRVGLKITDDNIANLKIRIGKVKKIWND